MKKLIGSVFFSMVAVLCLALLPVRVQAAKDGYFTYIVSRETATITECSVSASGDITIPDTLGNYPVTSIAHYAFEDCINLTGITLPNSITSIGDSAFAYCVSLTTISIPDSVTNIGDAAFANCTNLTAITLPAGITCLNRATFENCTSLVNVTVPNSVTKIQTGVFAGCSSLSNITLPDNMVCLDSCAFLGCSGLTSITIPNGIGTIADSTFKDCTKLSSVSIPGSVKIIGFGAFENCTSLAGVYISDLSAWCQIYYNDSKDNPLSLAGNLYLNGNLVTELNIPDSVKYIYKGAFYGCTSLTSVTLPSGTRDLEGRVFDGCANLNRIVIPQTLTDCIGPYAVPECPHILFEGTKEQWENIDKEDSSLSPNAVVTYNYAEGMDYHVYDGNSDTVCNACSATRLPIHTHTWDAGKVTQHPTQSAAGIMTYSCTACGASKTETIPQLTPAPTESVITQPAATDTTEPANTDATESAGATETTGATESTEISHPTEMSEPTQPSEYSPGQDSEKPASSSGSQTATIILATVMLLAGGAGFFLWKKGILIIKH